MNERKDERNNVRSTYLRLVSQSDLNQEGEWKNEKRKTEMKKKDSLPTTVAKMSKPFLAVAITRPTIFGLRKFLEE